MFFRIKFPPLLTSKQKEALEKASDQQLATQLKSLLRLYNQLYYNYTSIENESSDTSNSICSNLENTYKSLQNQTSKTNNVNNNNSNENKSSILIPLEYSITLDGIAGILPYNAFKIPPNRLPEIYRNRVAFAVFSINHSFENNNWYTTLRGQTIMLDVDKSNVSPISITPNLNNSADPNEIENGNYGKFSPNTGQVTYKTEEKIVDPYNEGKSTTFSSSTPTPDIKTVLEATPVWENDPLAKGNITIAEPYKDPDYTVAARFKWRIGFGSETTTRGGNVRNVKNSDKITREEAYDDLQRIMENITKPYVVGKLKERKIKYDELDLRVQVTFLDIAYNYGGNHRTLYNSFINAFINNGKQGLIDELQRRVKLGPNQVPTRRKKEIIYLKTGTIVSVV